MDFTDMLVPWFQLGACNEDMEFFTLWLFRHIILPWYKWPKQPFLLFTYRWSTHFFSEAAFNPNNIAQLWNYDQINHLSWHGDDHCCCYGGSWTLIPYGMHGNMHARFLQNASKTWNTRKLIHERQVTLCSCNSVMIYWKRDPTRCQEFRTALKLCKTFSLKSGVYQKIWNCFHWQPFSLLSWTHTITKIWKKLPLFCTSGLVINRPWHRQL